MRGLVDKDEFNILQDGVKRIVGLILSERYHLDMAIRDSAKAAYVAALILTRSKEAIRYEATPVEDWENETIGRTLTNKLNKLKKSQQQAFFYWLQVDKLFEKTDLLN